MIIKYFNLMKVENETSLFAPIKNNVFVNITMKRHRNTKEASYLQRKH